MWGSLGLDGVDTFVESHLHALGMWIWGRKEKKKASGLVGC